MFIGCIIFPILISYFFSFKTIIHIIVRVIFYIFLVFFRVYVFLNVGFLRGCVVAVRASEYLHSSVYIYYIDIIYILYFQNSYFLFPKRLLFPKRSVFISKTATFP